MSNQKITTQNDNMQTSLFPELKENKKPKRKLAPSFKPYNNKQIQVIYDIEALIPENHEARVVDEFVEAVPDEKLFSHYKGGGRPSYHPKMMLKIIIYAYTQKVYSCRGIEKLTKENLPAMWLAAMQQPDFRTINEFRGVRMQALIDELFETIIHKLMEENYISFENYFLDGTKIEADANRYTFVWKKSTLNYEEKLKKKIEETLEHIHHLTQLEIELEKKSENENSEIGEEKLKEIAEKLEEKVEILTEEMEAEKDTTVRKKKRKERSELKKAAKNIQEDFIPRMNKYKEQKEICGDRNSYSKTDKDATFMRMKEDHMKNGQLKPGYNVQMATENQFILFYTIHQRPADTRCFIPHFEKLKASTLPMPKTVVADAGYGSEENYLYALGEDDDADEERFEYLIPYGTYIKEQKRKYKKDIKNAKNWTYIEEDDCFICPNGRRVLFKRYQNKKNRSGYVQSYKIYECEDCTDCPLKPQCTKAKGNRQVHWNTIFEEMKAKAKRALECDKNSEIYSQRKTEVESVFGHIKGNRSFRRFSLREIHKVHVEFGIVALAHNILKVAGIRQLLSEKIKMASRKRGNFPLRLANFFGLIRQPLSTLFNT